MSRLAFPSNNINQFYNAATGTWTPGNRINPVAAAMLKYLPLPDTNIDNGSANYNRTSLIKSSWTSEYTMKVEHKFSDKLTLTGFYLYNRTNEPCANYFGSADQTEPTRFADPNDYLLVAASENSRGECDQRVERQLGDGAALRHYAIPRQQHAQHSVRSVDARLLRRDYIKPDRVSESSRCQNPRLRFVCAARRSAPWARTHARSGDVHQLEVDRASTATTRSSSATHTFKFGADFRKVGVDYLSPGSGAGYFDFDKDTTSSNGGTGSTTDGSAFASFLLGYPSALSSRQQFSDLATPLNIFTYYYGGYAQDDWRVNSKFTLNYGLRLEHETGMAEQNNNFTVGFDPKATSALSSVVIPADPVAGTPARNVAGGLMYAGVNGNPTTQGNPPKIKASPRVGARLFDLDWTRSSRRLRHLLGAVQLPGAEHQHEQLRPGRLHAEHAAAADPGDADRQPEQPVPERRAPAAGQRARGRSPD